MRPIRAVRRPSGDIELSIDVGRVVDAVARAHEKVIEKGVVGKSNVLEELAKLVEGELHCTYRPCIKSEPVMCSDFLAVLQTLGEEWTEKSIDEVELRAGEAVATVRLEVVRKWAGPHLRLSRLASYGDLAVSSMSMRMGRWVVGVSLGPPRPEGPR